MTRNEDKDSTLRYIKHGGRILLLPDVISYYFARRSLPELARTYYQYGYYKPLVAKKASGVVTVRQLVHGLFVLTLIATSLLTPVLPWIAIWATCAPAYLGTL